jgi:hypothetical protein
MMPSGGRGRSGAVRGLIPRWHNRVVEFEGVRVDILFVRIPDGYGPHLS